MSESLVPVVDFTWISDPVMMDNLELMVRKGMTASECAQLLGVQTTAVAHVLQANKRFRQVQMESLDRQRYLVTRKAANRADEVLDVLMNIIESEPEYDPESKSYIISTRDRISASKLYLDASGITGNKGAASESAMRLDKDESDGLDAATKEVIGILADRLQTYDR